MRKCLRAPKRVLGAKDQKKRKKNKRQSLDVDCGGDRLARESSRVASQQGDQASRRPDLSVILSSEI